MQNLVKKVLIVDDEPNIVLAIEFLLKQEGFIVFKAFNGEDGLRSAVEHTPDLIILDVMMPGLDGLTVAKNIRNTESLIDTTIIFLTAKGTSSDKLEGYDAGAECYLVKPFDNEELIYKVKDLLGLDV